MKKPLLVLYIVLGVVLGVFVLAFLLLFSAPGNALVKPYVEKIATEKSAMKVELGEFKLRFSSFSVSAKINECLNAAASGNFSIFSQTFSAVFSADADDLTKFGVNLKQKTELNGTVAGDLNAFDVAVGGNFANSPLNATATIANLTPKVVKFSAPSLDLPVLLALAAQPTYATGKLSMSADLADFKGTAKLATKGAKLDTAQVKKAFGVALDAPFAVEFASTTQLDLNAMNSTTAFDLTTPLANAHSKDAKFDINATKLAANYTLNVPNLAKLEKLAGYKLRGAFSGAGEAKFEPASGVWASLNANVFKGKLAAVFDGKTATAKLTNFRTEELLWTANFERFYLGSASLNAVYNVASGAANANVELTQGQLAANDITRAVKTLWGRDITQEIYKNGTFNAALKGNVASFSADLKSQRSTIFVANGTLNTKTNALNVPVKFTLEKTDVNVTIGGTTQKMTYNIKSDYLKNKATQKATKEVDKLLEKKGVKLNNETKDLIKGIFGK